MAIKHAFTILCEELILSQHKRISFINAFLNINTNSVPGGIPRFAVGVGFYGDVGDEFSIDLEGPPGDKHKNMKIAEGTIEEGQVGITETGLVGMAFTVSEYRPLIFTATGIHQIVLRDRKRKKVVHRLPFSVTLVEDTEETSNAEDRGESSEKTSRKSKRSK